MIKQRILLVLCCVSHCSDITCHVSVLNMSSTRLSLTSEIVRCNKSCLHGTRCISSCAAFSNFSLLSCLRNDITLQSHQSSLLHTYFFTHTHTHVQRHQYLDTATAKVIAICTDFLQVNRCRQHFLQTHNNIQQLL